VPAPGGAIVMGADYRGLGVARSLGRRGIPVCVLTEPGDRLAATSRYVTRRSSWPTAHDDARVAHLLRLAGDGLAGWALYPTTDDAAALVGRHHRELAEHFALTSPPWEVVRFAYDKRCTHELAAAAGVAVPATAYPRNRAELEALDLELPAILKPAVKREFNQFTAAKAWRVDSRAELLARYDEAAALVGAEAVMVQELIPGAGRTQFSYAALCRDGEVIADLVALRLRQYPPDFGRASTYVETVSDLQVVEPARRVLGKLALTGIAEVEFKLDPRDGRLKLLDVNPRVWGWHSLGAAAGVDFTYLLWRLVTGEPVDAATARPGVRWLRLSTDLPMAVRELAHGRMPLVPYLATLVRRPRTGAIFAADDPAPALAELPLLGALLVRRLLRGHGV
jgi:D-aspartate ligase